MCKLPKIVYKYRDWTNSYHKTILSKQEIYLASPSDFNDPFDCRITPNLDHLNSDKRIREFIKTVIERYKEKLLQSNTTIEEYETGLFDRLKNNKQKEQETWDNELFTIQDFHYGILSLSARWDSILMWGHYANCHAGFCVGFHEDKLSNSGHFGRGGLVKYHKEFPFIDPKEDFTPERAFRETFTKARDWSYEIEYRLFKFFKDKQANRIVTLDKSFYAELILGLNFPNKDMKAVLEFAGTLNIPVYKAEKRKHKFDLERKRMV